VGAQIKSRKGFFYFSYLLLRLEKKPEVGYAGFELRPNFKDKNGRIF
jgi:hypothetical protein